jgi:hypothetical protein
MKISLWVFKIPGFEGGIRVPKHGGPRNSPRVELLNHHTSKNSVMSFWMKISLWVFKIPGCEGGIGVPKRGGPLNSPGAWLLNHQTSKISINSIWMKFFCGCLKFEFLKVEFGFLSMEDP